MPEKFSTHLIGEVISIGDEMTSGARLDTNAQWLSRRLGELGVQVRFHSTVADNLDDNINVFRIAASRADVVVATGGLGPTRDDLTREALAKAANQPLVLDSDSLQHIESMFARRKRSMPKRNEIQAMFPETSIPIYNPQGTAPGIDLTLSAKREDGDTETRSSRIFALPGVPAEMKQMFDETVSPAIVDAISAGRCKMHIKHHVMKFFGTGESDMEARLGAMISRDRSPRVGITVSTATISLRITAIEESDAGCAQAIAQTREEILSRVSEFHFGDGESFEQHHAVDQLLGERGETLAVVELGRAALLGDWFSNLDERSCFQGGLTLGKNQDLTSLFGDPDTESALKSVAEKFAADWVLMVDGYPLLDHSADKPLPAMDIQLVIVNREGNRHQKTITLGGHPSIMHARIAKSALAFMRERLATSGPSRSTLLNTGIRVTGRVLETENAIPGTETCEKSIELSCQTKTVIS